MKRITLTRKGFREWLEGKPGDEVVGYTCDPAECPFARHLRDLGLNNPSMGISDHGSVGRPSVQNRKWVKRTVRGMDKISGGSNEPITARQALAVLEGKEAGA